MATILPKINHIQHSVLQSIWTGLNGATSDVGLPDQLSRYTYHSVQFTGTFASATAVLQGSDDGVNWFTLKDVTGASISTMAAARFDFVDVPMHIRPSTSGGSGGSITVIITSRSLGH